ncbi:MAG: hypothetical protein KGQ52_12025 [Alphaproteobacteria bacterium]|nr:hypothetical protein [Alphaproteobacteria bacterium]
MMRSLFLLAALLAAAPALADDAAPAKPTVQSCLHTRSIQQAQAGHDQHWYVRMRDGSWWRNKMECPGLAPRRALVHNSPIGSQCRGDIVQVVDFTMGGINFGGCGLADWERVDGPPAKAAKKAD